MPNALCFHPNCQAPLVPMWIYHLQVAAHGQHWLTGATICPNCGHRCLRNVCKGLPVGREKQLAALQRGRERDTWWWTDAQLIRSRAAVPVAARPDWRHAQRGVVAGVAFAPTPGCSTPQVRSSRPMPAETIGE